MNIQDLKSNTTWQEASNTINNNNNKISLAIATLENATLKNKGYFTTESNRLQTFSQVCRMKPITTATKWHRTKPPQR